MIAPEIDRTLKFFIGDVTSLGVFAYLCTILEPDHRHVISLRAISKITGIGRKKLGHILEKLHRGGVISYQVASYGATVVLNGASVVAFGPSNSLFRDAFLSSLPQPLTTTTESRSSLTRFSPTVQCGLQPLKAQESQSVTVVTPKANASGDSSSSPSGYDPSLFSSSDPELASPEPAATSDVTQTNQAKDQASQERVPLPQSADGSASTEEAPKKKVKKPRKKAPKYAPEDLELGIQWHQWAIETSPCKPDPSWSDDYFATHIATVKRCRGVEHEQMRTILAFIKQDKFWGKVTASPAGLNGRSKNGLHKVRNLLAAMEEQSFTLENGALATQIWDAYVEAWGLRYRESPEDTSVSRQTCFSLAKVWGEKGKQVIKFYVGIQDRYYIKQRHPLSIALRNQETVIADWKLGAPISPANAKSLENQFHISHSSKIVADAVASKYMDAPRPIEIAEKKEKSVSEQALELWRKKDAARIEAENKAKETPEFRHAIDFADKPMGQKVSDNELMSGSMGALLKKYGAGKD